MAWFIAAMTGLPDAGATMHLKDDFYVWPHVPPTLLDSVTKQFKKWPFRRHFGFVRLGKLPLEKQRLRAVYFSKGFFCGKRVFLLFSVLVAQGRRPAEAQLPPADEDAPPPPQPR